MFVGDNQLVNLTRIKTKNELIGEVIGLLMSPIQRVLGALQNRPETTDAATEVIAESAPEEKAPTAKAEQASESAPEVAAPAAKAEDAPTAESSSEAAASNEEQPAS